MRRFRSLQWQLTAAYTLVTLLVLIIATFVGGNGFIFYETLSGSIGRQLAGDLNRALSFVEVESENPTVEEIKEGILDQVWVQCQINNSLSLPPHSVNLNQAGYSRTCDKESEQLFLGLKVSPTFLEAYFDLNYLLIQVDGEGTIYVDEQGIRSEAPPLTDEQTRFIESSVIEKAIFEVHGLKTVVFAPLTINGSNVAILLEVGLLASPIFGGVNPISIAWPLMAVIFGFATVIGLIGSYWVTRRLSRRISRLGSLSMEWAQGNFTAVSHDRADDEIGQLSQRLNSMATQLQTLLEARLQLTAVEERNRLARDLHDSVKQQLFATDMQLYAAENLIETDSQKAETHLQEARHLTHTMQGELSTLIAELRPAQLEGKGLFEAVRETAVAFQKRNAIPIDLRLSGERELPLEVEQAIFRVVQEGLSNIVRHSGASRVVVHLAAERDKIDLSIEDDGVGIQPAQGQEGVGLSSMQERIEAVGGSFSIESASDQGTHIIVTTPIQQASHL